MNKLNILNNEVNVFKKIGFSSEDINALEHLDGDAIQRIGTNNIQRYYDILRSIETYKTCISLMNTTIDILKDSCLVKEPLELTMESYYRELNICYHKLQAKIEPYDFSITYSANLYTIYIRTSIFKGDTAIRIRPAIGLRETEYLREIIDGDILRYVVKYRNKNFIQSLIETEKKDAVLNLADKIIERLNEGKGKDNVR